MFFENRTEAGKKLAQAIFKKIPDLQQNPKGIVLALPRGGVPVAFEIAKKLNAPLDLIITHKLGAPGNPEFAIGAVAEDGSLILGETKNASRFTPTGSPSLRLGLAPLPLAARVGTHKTQPSPHLSCPGISQDYLKEEIRCQLREIQKRIKKYRGGRSLPKLQGKTLILVDDGIATGNTMKAACALAKNAKAARIIVAVPVLPDDALRSLQKIAEVVFLDAPSPFFAIGRFYRNFEQLTDEEVRGYLRDASK